MNNIVGTTNPDAHRGQWIQTYSGRAFYPLDPRGDEVDIVDIAHALSLVCRYGGHAKEFYSVAQHSVIVSSILPDDLALWGLLHDASEAYIGDMVRPLKREMVDFRKVEDRVQRAICERFGLSWPEPKEVIEADNVVLATEKRDLMNPSQREWGALPDPLDARIVALPPDEAYRAFMRRFHEVGRGAY